MGRRLGERPPYRGQVTNSERPVTPGYAPGVPLVAELLARRVRSDGAAPLVTYYESGSGARTELSATTLANWVAKTSNLLTDELLLPDGAGVELRVAERHPGHWMTLVWAVACWQTGAVVTVGPPGAGAGRV